MSEIVDIVSPALNMASFFTVDNTANGGVYVPVNPVAGPAILINSANKGTFVKGDSFTLLSAGLIIPESFSLWRDPALYLHSLPEIGFVAKGLSGDFYDYPNFNTSLQSLPMENFECAFDVFFNCAEAVNRTVHPNNLLTENYQLFSSAGFGSNLLFISMLGVPSSLNGKIFCVVPFFKILHTLPMV